MTNTIQSTVTRYCMACNNQISNKALTAHEWAFCEDCSSGGWALKAHDASSGGGEVLQPDRIPLWSISPNVTNNFIPVCSRECSLYERGQCRDGTGQKIQLGQTCIAIVSAILGYIFETFQK